MNAPTASILVVDDEPDLRTLYELTLLREGYRVETASSVQEAREQLKTQRFDAVVTDVNMPRMDGIELIRQLRQLPDYRFTPLLMLTTESGGDKKAEGKAAGATGWLVKPFDPEQLLATVRKVLG